ncbi:MAG: penicillin-binding protein 2 [Caldilineaceae bacterium]|nr:penicillin-binding protein 2 [Caldilineaceae bacterium]
MASLFPENRTIATSSLVTAEPQSNGEAVEENQKRRAWRFWLLACLFLLLTSLVLARLVVYQLFQFGQQPAYDATQFTLPVRGSIVDRGGELLASDRILYQVIATPNEIKTEQARQEVAQRLQEIAGLPMLQTLQTLNTYAQGRYAELGEPLDVETSNRVRAMQAQAVAENQRSPLRYITIRPTPVRFHPQNALASHILGFIQANRAGVYGLEEYYNAFLNERGVGLLERTAATFDTLPNQARRYLPSIVGKDLILTIDRSIQWIIEEELRSGIAKYRAQSGTIIVMEPQSGAILGMANWPDYDPNQRAASQADYARFANVSISAIYEPGSVFKIVTMAAGLDTGVITPTTVMTDSGYIIIGERSIYNSDRRANGQVDVTQALARSLNVITAQVAERVGRDRFYQYVRRFGFGERTGIDLAGELPGLLKTPGHEMWSLSDLGTNSFGQGLAVTPLQMINATAAIANGGVLMRPYIVQARSEDNAVLYTQPEILGRAIRPETAHAMTEMMVETVNTGNSAARVPGYRIAGKSGTAQIPDVSGYLKDATIVTFVGFAPADDPKFVLLVKLDQPDPAISQWAAYTAAPVFAQISRRLFDYLNIPPDDIRNQVAHGATSLDPTASSTTGDDTTVSDNRVDGELPNELSVPASE